MLMEIIYRQNSMIVGRIMVAVDDRVCEEMAKKIRALIDETIRAHGGCIDGITFKADSKEGDKRVSKL